MSVPTYHGPLPEVCGVCYQPIDYTGAVDVWEIELAGQVGALAAHVGNECPGVMLPAFVGDPQLRPGESCSDVAQRVMVDYLGVDPERVMVDPAGGGS